jgi:hypothetical protein
MHHERIIQLVSGVGIALAMFALAYVTAVAPEDSSPSRSPVLAAMRSRRGRYAIAALMTVFGLVILILHILKFVAE